MSLHVEGEVVGAREGALAHLALEGLGARVLTIVTRQLVRPSEPPLTLGPVTPIWLLTCRAQGVNKTKQKSTEIKKTKQNKTGKHKVLE